MPKGSPTECARDNRGHVVNGLRVQKTKDNHGRSLERFYASTKDGRRRYFGNNKNRREAIRKYRNVILNDVKKQELSNAWSRSPFGKR